MASVQALTHPKRPKPPKPQPGKGISLLVPFHDDGGEREHVWNWLRRYWECRLPGVEIVKGKDKKSDRRFFKKPFSKTRAVNDAFSRSRGDIIVILDADTFIHEDVVTLAAERIRVAVDHGVRTWYVPYRNIFRLTKEATKRVLRSRPCDPVRFPSPPDESDTEGREGSAYGHRYGALIQIMPREAFELVGGMDCRFRGWGGEDVSFLRALDTLYARHKNLPGDVLHLWHPIHRAGHWQDPKGAWWETRIWAGQKRSRANDALTILYMQATYKPAQMRALVNDGLKACCSKWQRLFRRCHPKHK